MKIATPLLLVAIIGLASAQTSPFSDLILTENKGIAILTPIVVCKGEILQHEWSSDGKYLLVHAVDRKLTPESVRSIIQGNASRNSLDSLESVLTLLNVDKETLATPWRSLNTGEHLRGLQWIPGRNQYLITISVVDQSSNDDGATVHDVLSWFSPTTGRLSQFYQALPGEFVQVFADPKSGNAVLVSRKVTDRTAPNRVETTLVWIARDGRLGRAIKADSSLRFDRVMWGAKTSRPILANWKLQPGKKPVRDWLELDFASGEMKAVQNPEIDEPKEPSFDFQLLPGPTLTRSQEVSKNLRGAWIVANQKGPNQCGLIAAEVDSMDLSPTGNAVFYSTKGIGFVRGLAEIPKEVALQAIAAAQKSKLISETKQAATAFLMFAADSDDMLPSPSSDWNGALQPYLRDATLLDGFIYSFGGGNVADVENPANTVLGYKQGQGGRAVAYVDGHVKWIPDP